MFNWLNERNDRDIARTLDAIGNCLRSMQPRASAEKFLGGGGNEKRPKHSTIKPLLGEGPIEIKIKE